MVRVHRSSSREQLAVEPLILAGVAAEAGAELGPVSLLLPGGAHVDIDGAALDRSVLVEVFAHQGRLRGSQFHKVARDALKLITIARQHPGARLIVAFGDEAAAACVTGNSWLAEALRTWGVEVMVVSLEEEVRAGLVAAQARQVMINPPASDEARREAQAHRP